MNAFLLGSLSLVSLTATCLTAAGLDQPLADIRAVGKEGAGNEKATAAWQRITQADPASLPAILTAMNGANPLAENWLRAAIGVLADQAIAAQKLPVEALQAFLLDTQNSAAPRVVAFDLLQRAEPKRAAKITPQLLEDPSSELRRHPVAKLLGEGEEALAQGRKDAALTAFQQAMKGARDEDQIKDLAKKLKDLGSPVDLPTHFGFLRQWKLIAPFTNVERKGFDTVFPPEEKIDLAATYPGKNTEAKWIDYTSTDEYGQIDFNKPYTMLKEVTGYAYTEFESGEEREAQIRLGCKNGWKVWLNGQLIFARDEYHRGAKLDQYKLPVKLQKGKNKILVKCCQNEQTESWTVEWQFQLRLCDDTGTAILAKK
jgi:tetratricopeptide (TPR) repeat protein